MIHGHVVLVSADRLTNPKANNPNYVALVKIDVNETRPHARAFAQLFFQKAQTRAKPRHFPAQHPGTQRPPLKQQFGKGRFARREAQSGKRDLAAIPSR